MYTKSYNKAVRKINAYMKGVDADRYMKIMVILSLIVLIAPVLATPLPSYIHNGDISLHYKLTYLVSEDFGNVAYENYPKFYHILSSIPINVFGIPVEAGIIFTTLIFTILFPLSMYKLSLELTKNKTASLLSTIIAMNVVIHSSVLTGITLSVTHTLAMTFLPSVLYLFMSRRFVLSAIVLGMYMITHGSWPIAIISILSFSILKLRYEKDTEYLKKMLVVFVIAGVIYAPLTYYIKDNLFHDTIISTVAESQVYIRSMIPLISFFLITSPFFILPVFVYGLWRSYKERHKLHPGILFLIIVFLILAAMTQTFYFVSTGLIAGLTFIPSRIIPFMIIPISIITAVTVYRFSDKKNIRKLIVLSFSAIVLVSSLPGYLDWYSSRGMDMREEMPLIEKLQSSGNTDETVLYNPSMFFAKEGNIVEISAKNRLDQKTAFLILGGFKEATSGDFQYVLHKKNDKLVSDFISDNAEKIDTIDSTSDYRLYRFDSPGEPSKKENNLEETINAFTVFYNNHGKIGKVFDRQITLKLESADTGEAVCVIVGERAEISECEADGLLIRGDYRDLNEIFSTYSVSEFSYRLLWFYGNDKIHVELEEDAEIGVTVPKKIPFFSDKVLYLHDIDSSVNVISEAGGTKVTMYRGTERDVDHTTSLKFLSRTVQWVLPNSATTYPNIIPGAINAALRPV